MINKNTNINKNRSNKYGNSCALIRKSEETVSVIITSIHGCLDFNGFDTTKLIHVYNNCNNIQMKMSFSDVSTVLNQLSYVPDVHWNGDEKILVSVIYDNIENNTKENISQEISVKIVPVDNFPDFFIGEKILKNSREKNLNLESIKILNFDDFSVKIAEGESSRIFDQIRIFDVDSVILNLKITVSHGFLGMKYSDKNNNENNNGNNYENNNENPNESEYVSGNERSNIVEIVSTAEECSSSLQSLVLTAPSIGTFRDLVSTDYI